MLFGHGSDAYKYSRKIIADFSSNIWYKGLPEGLTECLYAEMVKLVHYPEPDAGKLAKKIAEFHDVSDSKVLVSNGASEAFYLIAQLYAKAKSGIVFPSFSEYEDACSIHNHELFFINNRSINFSQKFDYGTTIWLGNPNNPDGKTIDVDNLVSWIKLNPKTIFIFDEAYGDLCYGFESLVDFSPQLPNLIIIKSLTKAYAIPGLRLGYVIASSQIIESLKRIKIPWSVNSLAIEAGIFVLKDYKKHVPNKNNLYKQVVEFQQQLSSIPNIKVTPSNCNYFLVELKKSKAADLKNHLANIHGLLIRDASNFRGLTEHHFRVALQNADMNLKLVDVIKNWIQNV